MLIPPKVLEWVQHISLVIQNLLLKKKSKIWKEIWGPLFENSISNRQSAACSPEPEPQ